MTDLVELQLRKPELATADAGTWKPLVLQFLRVLSDVEREGESAETVALRARLDEHRRQIGGALHPQEERQEGAACLRTCEQYLLRVQADHRARESELTELVTLLRDATARMIGEASGFHAEILSSADRLKVMGRLDDIRELKRELSTEITSLERVVETQKERDRAAMEKLSKRVELLQADLGRAEERASLDPLTKLANRESFDRALERMVGAARTSAAALSLAMLDIDHFKKINDTYGHPVGDRVLLCMAEWLRGSIRRQDVVARYGGEEFVVILEATDLRQAEERFAAVLAGIANRSYEFDDNGVPKSIRFTVSCGVAQLADADTPADLVGRADQALYDAKHKGRNRVVAKKYSRLARLLSR